MASVNGRSQAEMIISEAEPGNLIALISGELDILSVERLDGQIGALLAGTAKRVDLDLSDLDFMDSSGISMLLRITNQFGPCEVRGAKPIIRRVIEVTGLTEVLCLKDGAS
jgi:anti-anti-sigma factor